MMSEFGDKWEKDQLNRQEDADFLSKYLIEKHKKQTGEKKNSSFVLNINAEWGHGKTYFLKNWAADLSENHPVVYFDAWQNDFSKEPLLALISTINDQLKPHFTDDTAKERMKSWYQTAKKLILPSTPLLMSILAKKAFGMSREELSELFNNESDDQSKNDPVEETNNTEIDNTISTVVSKAASRMLETHSSTKQTISEFKENLGKLTTHLDENEEGDANAPIFILVDELDRCRPDYAIEILENIKHLFGVSGVTFIVATASEQLSHSIKAVYGESFDGENYLKRFFNQTYTIKSPDRYTFAKYLFSSYGLEKRQNLYSPLLIDQCPTGNNNIEVFAWLTSIFECGLRDMEQYCLLIDTISLTFKEEEIHLIYLLFLIILKQQNSNLYEALKKAEKLSYKELKFNPTEIDKKFMRQDIYHANGFSELNFSGLIDIYFSFSKLNISDLHRKDFSRQYFHAAIREKLPKHYLLKYPSLIEQCGRIS